MSYCVNCGVELDGSLKKCPLCNTMVLNPRELNSMKSTSPFPEEKGQVEAVKRKDFGILLSAILIATGATCGILNLFVFQGTAWSLLLIGGCLLLWVMLVPLLIYTRLSGYAALVLDGLFVGVYLYMITFVTGGDDWFWGLGLPITVLVTAVAELFTLCVKKLPSTFITVTLYFFTAIGVLCAGLEILIDWYLDGRIHLVWSAVVVTVCFIIDIALITMLSSKRLRNAVRRRMHF